MTQAPEFGASQWTSNHSHEAARADLLRSIADELLEATSSLHPIGPVRERVADMTLDDAYVVQSHQLVKHLDAGRELAGRKIGLTSPAIQKQLGVDSPDFGFFFTDMVHADGETVNADDFISPKVEPELAMVLKEPLRGPGVTLDQARTAVGEVIPALEIIDSRVRDWDIALVDTVADNASCGAIVLGSEPLQVDLSTLAEVSCQLLINDSVAEEGVGSAVMNDPVEPLAWLANVLGERGETLEAGQVVLTGSFTRALPVVAGEHVRVNFPGLGGLRVEFA